MEVKFHNIFHIRLVSHSLHPSMLQDAGVRGREWEERSSDPRTGQEEQPLGGEGEVRHHVEFESRAGVGGSGGGDTSGEQSSGEQYHSCSYSTTASRNNSTTEIPSVCACCLLAWLWTKIVMQIITIAPMGRKKIKLIWRRKVISTNIKWAQGGPQEHEIPEKIRFRICTFVIETKKWLSVKLYCKWSCRFTVQCLQLGLKFQTVPASAPARKTTIKKKYIMLNTKYLKRRHSEVSRNSSALVLRLYNQFFILRFVVGPS